MINCVCCSPRQTPNQAHAAEASHSSRCHTGCVAYRAGQFYADAGLPCPVNRAMADHFLFCMNTDFKRVAADFSDAPQGQSDIEGFLPFLPGGAGEKLARGNSVTDAEESIVALRDTFEKRQRVCPPAPGRFYPDLLHRAVCAAGTCSHEKSDLGTPWARDPSWHPNVGCVTYLPSPPREH